jgi:plastocyanin
MKRSYYLIALFLLLSTGSTHATTHIITAVFSGGSFTYSPATPLTVNVGDTIDWQMNFSIHTLKVTFNGNTVVDDGASTGMPPGGTDEIYVVPSVGSYSFLCTIHAAMNSSFTAVASGVEIPNQTTMSMDPIYPNPAMEDAMVHFTLDKPAHVTLRIYNSAGTLMQTPSDEDMETGFHMLMIDTKQLASGSYQYVLQVGNDVMQRAAVVVK